LEAKLGETERQLSTRTRHSATFTKQPRQPIRLVESLLSRERQIQHQ
jgi:hypothetical protein